jgi:hypothetical protein
MGMVFKFYFNINWLDKIVVCHAGAITPKYNRKDRMAPHLLK